MQDRFRSWSRSDMAREIVRLECENERVQSIAETMTTDYHRTRQELLHEQRKVESWKQRYVALLESVPSGDNETSTLVDL